MLCHFATKHAQRILKPNCLMRATYETHEARTLNFWKLGYLSTQKCCTHKQFNKSLRTENMFKTVERQSDQIEKYLRLLERLPLETLFAPQSPSKNKAANTWLKRASCNNASCRRVPEMYCLEVCWTERRHEMNDIMNMQASSIFAASCLSFWTQVGRKVGDPFWASAPKQ